MYTGFYIVSTGRSGTTILSQSLSAHPEVICRSIYPYETRASQHLFNWDSNGRIERHLRPARDPNSKASYKLFLRNDELSFMWWKNMVKGVKKKPVIKLINEYYQFISSVENKTNCKFYLEKATGSSTVIRMHNAEWPLKAILLIRDPRDILLSVKSFNSKRKRAGFGVKRFTDSELLNNYIKFFINTQKSFTKNNLNFCVVKYDSMIQNPSESFEKMAKDLSLDSSSTSIELMLESFKSKSADTEKHVTQKNINSSSRWREEASTELLDIYKKHDDSLQLLGYEKT